MSQLTRIYQLLQQEYARSRHLFWLEAERPVNDVTYTLRLLVQAARGLHQQDETAWRELVIYAMQRAMSPVLLLAMDEYLRDCGSFPPLPLIPFEEKQPDRNWRGGTIPLLDESDTVPLAAAPQHPEPDRNLALKGKMQWSHPEPRLRDLNPHHTHKNQTRATHWLLT